MRFEESELPKDIKTIKMNYCHCDDRTRRSLRFDLKYNLHAINEKPNESTAFFLLIVVNSGRINQNSNPRT